MAFNHLQLVVVSYDDSSRSTKQRSMPWCFSMRLLCLIGWDRAPTTHGGANKVVCTKHIVALSRCTGNRFGGAYRVERAVNHIPLRSTGRCCNGASKVVCTIATHLRATLLQSMGRCTGRASEAECTVAKWLTYTCWSCQIWGSWSFLHSRQGQT